VNRLLFVCPIALVTNAIAAMPLVAVYGISSK
jgi:hypothetical protein